MCKYAYTHNRILLRMKMMKPFICNTWIKFEGVLLSKIKQEDEYPLILLTYGTE